MDFYKRPQLILLSSGRKLRGASPSSPITRQSFMIYLLIDFHKFSLRLLLCGKLLVIVTCCESSGDVSKALCGLQVTFPACSCQPYCPSTNWGAWDGQTKGHVLTIKGLWFKLKATVCRHCLEKAVGGTSRFISILYLIYNSGVIRIIPIIQIGKESLEMCSGCPRLMWCGYLWRMARSQSR